MEFGRYRRGRFIGSGASGDVYEGVDTSTGGLSAQCHAATVCAGPALPCAALIDRARSLDAGEMVAIQSVDCRRFRCITELEAAQAEASLLSALRHRHIVSPPLCLCQGGSRLLAAGCWQMCAVAAAVLCEGGAECQFSIQRPPLSPGLPAGAPACRALPPNCHTLCDGVRQRRHACAAAALEGGASGLAGVWAGRPREPAVDQASACNCP